MTAHTLTNQVLLAIGSHPDIRLFRNHVGFGYSGKVLRRSNHLLQLSNYYPVTFGLHVGSSDLIGWRSVVITPEMVGRRVAIFAGVEIKTPNDTVKPGQRLWDINVRKAGGISVIARTADILSEMMI